MIALSALDGQAPLLVAAPWLLYDHPLLVDGALLQATIKSNPRNPSAEELTVLLQSAI